MSLGAGSVGPGAAGILGRLLHGDNAPAVVTPEQAAAVTPAEAEQIVRHAEQHTPGIVDRMSDFYAGHPQLIKSLGAAALGIAMAQMANRS